MVHLELLMEAGKGSSSLSSRKVINSKLNKKNNIEVWGDGKQTRSFYLLMTV